MEQKRANRRWTLTVAPLGTAVVFLSAIVTAGGHGTTYTVALYMFAVAIPVLSLIAFLTSLQEATKLPQWWEASVGRLLLAGYTLVAIGIGALLHRAGGALWQIFAAACVGSLVVALFALPRSRK